MLAHIVYNPESHNETLSFSVTNASLFNLPGGAAGIAATAEFGNQGYDLNTDPKATGDRSEEHTSELQSLMRNSYAVFCLKKKKKNNHDIYTPPQHIMNITKHNS